MTDGEMLDTKPPRPAGARRISALALVATLLGTTAMIRASPELSQPKAPSGIRYDSAPAAAPSSPMTGRTTQSPLVAGVSIRLVTPKSGEIVSGATVLEAEVLGTTASAVEFYVDGKSVGVAPGPPYRITFDFGDSLASRKVLVLARFDGNVISSNIVTTRAFDLSHVDQVAEVDLVNVYVTVRDRSGKLVQGLTQKDFIVTENGRPQEISHFSSERKGLVAALVIDSSLSMKQEAKMDAAREAATQFIAGMGPDDRALVLGFNQDVTMQQELTNDHAALNEGIARCEPLGGTALYDAVYRAADRLAPIEGRKVVLLLSDGRDEDESGLDPGSLHTLEEAVDRTLHSEVILYAVGLGKDLDREMDFYGKRSLLSLLDQISTATGGHSLFLRKSSQLREAFAGIQEELRYQYAVAYAPGDLRRDGAWRELKVTMKKTDLRAFTRAGYFAPKSRR